MLQWKQCSFIKTVKLNKLTNVVTFRLVHRYMVFKVYYAIAGFNESQIEESVISQEDNIIEDAKTSYCKSEVLTMFRQVLMDLNRSQTLT